MAGRIRNTPGMAQTAHTIGSPWKMIAPRSPVPESMPKMITRFLAHFGYCAMVYHSFFEAQYTKKHKTEKLSIDAPNQYEALVPNRYVPLPDMRELFVSYMVKLP